MNLPPTVDQHCEARTFPNDGGGPRPFRSNHHTAPADEFTRLPQSSVDPSSNLGNMRTYQELRAITMPDPVEEIVAAYVEAAEGDRDEALRRAVADALADLSEAERRAVKAERLVSKGYVRGGVVEPSGEGSREAHPD